MRTRCERGHLVAACIWNSTWTGAQAITPWLMGEAVTTGIVGRSEAALAWWSAAILAVGAVIALSAMGGYDVQSYGKGGVVGLNGEQEHANALLTTAFANPIRDLLAIQQRLHIMGQQMVILPMKVA